MTRSDLLADLDRSKDVFQKDSFVESIVDYLISRGYEVAEVNTQKPWGAYVRMSNESADSFIEEFFPGLSPSDARLGVEGAELSPKILIVTPGQRLSWQYHYRRAERWVFLTNGSYNKSMTDEPGDACVAEPGHIVQFSTSERHRLNGLKESVVVAAEIWQHTDSEDPSDEDDIVRLFDDYSR